MATFYLSEDELNKSLEATNQIREIDDILEKTNHNTTNGIITEDELHYLLDNNYPKEQVYSLLEEKKNGQSDQVLVSTKYIKSLERIALLYKETLLKELSDIRTKQKERELEDIKSKDMNLTDDFLKDFYKKREEELEDDLGHIL